MYPCTVSQFLRTSTGLQRVVGVSTMRVEAKKGSKAAGKAVAKSDLPSKICVVCKRPFTWRKKWESSWDEVKYCSERCRRSRNVKAPNEDPGAEPET